MINVGEWLKEVGITPKGELADELSLPRGQNQPVCRRGRGAGSTRHLGP